MCKVLCKKCKWQGKKSELPKIFDEIEMSTLEICPACKDAWNLIDVD